MCPLLFFLLKISETNRINIIPIDDFHCRRVIQRAEAQAFAEENGLEYIEASAKTSDGVDEAFIGTAERIWDKIKNGGLKNPSGGDDVSIIWMMFAFCVLSMSQLLF